MNDQYELEELQSRLSFQEDTLSQLNQVVVRQAGQIERLEQQLWVLAGKYRTLREALETGAEGHSDPGEEKPPHY